VLLESVFEWEKITPRFLPTLLEFNNWFKHISIFFGRHFNYVFVYV
jgi:hypothetical protein